MLQVEPFLLAEKVGQNQMMVAAVVGVVVAEVAVIVEVVLA